jgi:hypothetical protein
MFSKPHVLCFLLIAFFGKSLQQIDECPLYVRHTNSEDSTKRDTIVENGKTTDLWEITPYVAEPFNEIDLFDIMRLNPNNDTVIPQVVTHKYLLTL